MKTCGCRIDGAVKDTIVGTYCPMHAAAPDMLMVLRCLAIYYHGEAGPSFMPQARSILACLGFQTGAPSAHAVHNSPGGHAMELHLMDKLKLRLVSLRERLGDHDEDVKGLAAIVEEHEATSTEKTDPQAP